MSRRRWAGLLEGMDCVAEDVIAQQWLEGPAAYHVPGAVEEFVDVELQPGVRENPHGPILIEVNQHIDVARRRGFTPCDGAEYRGVRHAQIPQLALVSA